MLLFSRCRLRIAAGLLLAATLLSPAADTANSMFTRVWRSQDGMPWNEVTGIAQDGSGYLWIAYPNGLARFDGIRFQSVPLPLPAGRGLTAQMISSSAVTISRAWTTTCRRCCSTRSEGRFWRRTYPYETRPPAPRRGRPPVEPVAPIPAGRMPYWETNR